MTTIGDRFKIIRMDNDFSQTNFAKLLGVSLSAYKNYELNKTPVPHTARASWVAMRRELVEVKSTMQVRFRLD